MSPACRYQPGSAYLAVGPGCGALTPDADLALRLWPLISRDAALPALLDEALENGLGQLPDLLLFELDSSTLRVIVRGEPGVSVRLPDGVTDEVDGVAVRTWNERVFEHPVLMTVGQNAESGLPIVNAVVAAGGFQWVWGAERDDIPGHLPATPDSALQADTPAASSPAEAPAPAEAPEPADAPEPAETPAPADASAPAISAAGISKLPDTRIEPIDDSFEHLFESTVMRSVEDAAVRKSEDPAVPGRQAPDADLTNLDPANPANPEHPAQATGGPPAPHTATRPGDHDGSTILAGQLVAVLASTEGRPSLTPPPSQTPAPTPTAGAAASGVATLVLSTGQTVGLDRSVVIGRRPVVDRVSGPQIPHLVTVPSPQQDISRSHIAVRPAGSGCVAVDLGSTNGSLIHRAAGGTVALRSGGTLDLQIGDVIDLGDGVTAALRAPS